MVWLPWFTRTSGRLPGITFGAARPATVRAYELGDRYRRRDTPMDDEAKKILFGQTAAVLGPPT